MGVTGVVFVGSTATGSTGSTAVVGEVPVEGAFGEFAGMAAGLSGVVVCGAGVELDFAGAGLGFLSCLVVGVAWEVFAGSLCILRMTTTPTTTKAIPAMPAITSP